MCYAIGTEGIPTSKLRCDCNTGEMKKIGEAHRGAARTAERKYSDIRGRSAARVESSTIGTSPAPYPVSEPVITITRDAGWSGLSPLDAVEEAPKKKPKKNPKPRTPEPEDELENTVERSPEDQGEDQSEHQSERDLEEQTENDNEQPPEESVEPSVERDLEKPLEQFALQPDGTVTTQTLAAARGDMTRDQFADAVAARMDNPDSPIYVDPNSDNAELARAAITDVLYEQSPGASLLYNEELSAQGKTPTYHLAEMLNPAQRDAVAHAARVRSQELGHALSEIHSSRDQHDIDRRVSTSTDLGACVGLAADMRFATELEKSGDDATRIIERAQKRADVLNRDPVEVLTSGDKKNADALKGLLEKQTGPHTIMVTDMAAVDVDQLRKDMVGIGAVDEEELDRDIEKFMRKAGKGTPFGYDSRKQYEDILATAVIISTIKTNHDNAQRAGGGNGRGTHAPMSRAETDALMSGQKDVAKIHADLVKEEMESVAPRHTGSYTNVIGNRTKSGLPKKVQAVADEAGSFLNAEDFAAAADDLRSRGVDLSVNKTTARPRYTTRHNLRTGEVQSTIRVNDHEPSVTLHETMHFMEDGDENYRAAAVTFLRGRTKGLKRERIAGGANGSGIADSFSDHYVGRIYDPNVVNEKIPPHTRNLATEVLSVGAEHLYDHAWEAKSLTAFTSTNKGKVPATALYDDPEHAAFTRGMLTGSRRDAPTATI